MKIQVHCPRCSKTGKIDIEDSQLKNIESGLLAVEIPSNLICEHFFIAYIDKNGDVRNYCVADFELHVDQKIEKTIQIDDTLENLDVFLIKINIYPSILTYIIKAILFGKKVLIITEDPLLEDHIRNFFEYITRDSFVLNLTITNTEQDQKSGTHSDYDIIFQGNKIIKQEATDFSLEDLDIEENIVQRFLNEEDLTTGLVLLKNELTKLFEITKFFKELIKKTNGSKKKINPKKIVKRLQKTYNFTLSTKYLDLVYSILSSYFSVNVPAEIKNVFQLFLGITSF